MDGIHDLGGRHGFGRSLEDPDQEQFHADWEPRLRAIASLLIGAGCWNVDTFRHAIERVEPQQYLSSGYFGRWLLAVEMLVEEAGGRPQPGLYDDTTAQRRIDRGPRFGVGDVVVTVNRHPAGHTRLPGYARARHGTVVLHHDSWVLPDRHAHGEGESPEHVYAVRFEGQELWGDTAEPRTCVHIDLFESYLEPA